MLPGVVPLAGMPRWHPVVGHPHLEVPVLLLAVGAFALVLAVGLAVPRDPAPGRGSWPDASWDGSLTTLQKVVRAVSLATLLVCVVAARAGNPDELDNLAPALVLGAGWPLLFLGALLLPTLWRWLDPWDTAARVLTPGDRSEPRDDVRPAVLVALPLLWYVCAHRTPLDPRHLGLALAAYSVVTLAGCLALGRRRWLATCEPVGAVLTWVGRARPGRFAGRQTPAGLGALLGVVGAATLFRLVRRTEAWSERMDPTDQVSTTLAFLVACALGAGFVSGLAWVAQLADPGPSARSVVVLAAAPAVAGIVVAVGLARNLLTTSLQLLPGLVGDPLGRGWDLLGEPTAGLTQAPFGTAGLLAVQLAVVVAGHLWGAVLAARLTPRASRLPALVLLAQSAAGSVAVLSAH